MRKIKNSDQRMKKEKLKSMKELTKLLNFTGEGERNIQAIEQLDLKYLEYTLLQGLTNGVLFDRSEIVKLYNHDKIKFGSFTVKHGIYGIPNKELVALLKYEIGDKSEALEIGAGNGLFARFLGIRSVDNYMQQNKTISDYYLSSGQYPIRYTNNEVENIDAIEAVKKYKPKVVFGSYITDKFEEGDDKDIKANIFGIPDHRLFDLGVEKYILICSEQTHDEKKIYKRKDLDFKKIYNITTARNMESSYLLIATKKKI